MGNLLKSATTQEALLKAWRRIRENGRQSNADETVTAIELFENDTFRNIRKIQKRVRNKTFEFDPQKGVLKSKSDGSKRGIVMASVHNRVVERALLECLQSQVDFVRDVITQPTSVGGVPHRSVPHGLAQIRDAFDGGAKFFVRSDVSGFFDHIPRKDVLSILKNHIDDSEFLEILNAATTVTLQNETALGEDRKAFPTDSEGVAQGSPLSALFGNILLNDFDKRFNGRGVTGVRFIDDFLLLGNSEAKVKKAFTSAEKALKDLNLDCHDPYSAKTNPDKSECGRVDAGFIFLGYDIRPGLYQPSKKARKNLLTLIDEAISIGQNSIRSVAADQNSFARSQRFVQTCSRVDRILRGWGNSFAYGNSTSTIGDLDRRVDKKIFKFRRWFNKQYNGKDWKEQRRIYGICLLTDVESKSLDELPFVINSKMRFSKSKNTVTISTDGSVLADRKRRASGPGGWAFVIHDSGIEKWGTESSTTNNRMELTAVVEAIRNIPKGGSVIVRTDSQYVEQTINRGRTVKKNIALWREFEKLRANRRIKINWVKGHSGDSFNERADKLANEAAQNAKAGLHKVSA